LIPIPRTKMSLTIIGILLKTNRTIRFIRNW
jgi:hypothetical protein